MATVSMEFDATVQLPSPAHDAVTGQTTSTLVLDDPPAQYAVEAGYDAAGAFVFNQYALDPPGDPLTQSVSPVRTMSVHNGRIELLDVNDEYVLGTAPGNGPTLQTLLNAPATEALQLLDDIVLSKAPLPSTETDLDGASVAITNVSLSGDLLTVQAQISASGTPTLPQRRIYRRTVVGGAERFTLLEARTDIALASGASQISGQAVLRVSGLSWSRNAARDQMRRDGTAGSAFGTTPAGIGQYEPPPCGTEECPDPPPPVTPGGSPGPGNGAPAPGCGNVAGGANVVFVHGILSDGNAWGDPAYDNRVRGRTRCDLAINRDIAPPLTSGAHHTVQTTELVSAVTNSQQQQNIFVGHSQGGLISRRAAQGFTRGTQANLVRGVITVGTPHVGANIARNLPTNVFEGVASVFSQPLACRITGSCSIIGSGLNLIRQTILTGVGLSAADALSDMRPGSSALTEVNTVPEGPLFPRYGIQNYVNKRWAFARIAGDLTSNESGAGPFFVGVMDVTFGAATIIGVAGVLTGSWGVAAFCVRVLYALVNTDQWWHRITAGGATTDGVVEGPSQVYPGAILNFQAETPTSHTGEVDTHRSYVEIEQVLRLRFGVQPR